MHSAPGNKYSLKQMIECFPYGTLILNTTKDVVLANKAAERMFEKAESELKLIHFTELLSENSDFTEAAADDNAAGQERKMYKRNGDSRYESYWVRFDKLAYYDYTMCVIRDMSYAQKLTHENLAAMIASSTDAIITKNMSGRILSWNNAAEKLFGFSAEEAVGQEISIIIPAEKAHEESIIMSHVKNEQAFRHETYRLTKDAGTIEVALTVSPLRNKAGEVVGAMKIARDNSEQAARFQRLVDNNKQLFELTHTLLDNLRTQIQDIQYLTKLSTAKNYNDAEVDHPKILEERVTDLNNMFEELLQILNRENSKDLPEVVKLETVSDAVSDD